MDHMENLFRLECEENIELKLRIKHLEEENNALVFKNKEVLQYNVSDELGGLKRKVSEFTSKQSMRESLVELTDILSDRCGHLIKDMYGVSCVPIPEDQFNNLLAIIEHARGLLP